MKEKWTPHIIAVLVLVVFIVLGVGSATGPKIGVGEASMLYFNANGGIGQVPDSQTVEKGASFTIPGGEGLSFGDATFVGWYSESSSDDSVTNYKAGESFIPPGGYITLYAKWELEAKDFKSVTGFANKMVWLLNNAENGTSYTIELASNESIGTQRLFYPGKSNITITLIGSGGNRTISSAVNNSIFVVLPGVTLVLDNNITLQGNNDNKEALVEVRAGRFRMNNGSTITGNGVAGVIVSGMSRFRGDNNPVKGIFEMNGGIISKNYSNKNAKYIGGVSNGAVNLNALGTFTMSNGTISDNIGVGVFIWNDALFTMNDGSITGNSGVGFPGGIRVWYNSTFTMNNGTISDNGGGGVDVMGTFIMNGGNITRNTVAIIYHGGGVKVHKDATFLRGGGTISGNTPDNILFE